MGLAHYLISSFTLLGLVHVIKWVWKNFDIFQWTPRSIKYAWNIPGPTQIYGIGNILQFAGSPEQVFKKMRRVAKEYPRIFKLWAVNRCGIFLLDPGDIEVLMTSNDNISKGLPYDFVSHWLCSGLLTSTGEKWKRRRKLLTPAFHFNILKQFVPIFENCADQSIKDLQMECKKESTEVTKVTVEHALHTLCQTTMGINIDRKSHEVSEYKKAIHRFGEMTLHRSFRPWLHIDDILFKTEFWKTSLKTIDILRKFTTKVIHHRLASPRIAKSNESKLAMLDLLIEQMRNDQINIDGICEEVDTFMFEGHDTVSMALTMILMLLANNPTVQDKIYKEQTSIIDDPSQPTTYEDLQKMEYLERCIKESLRLYPPVPVISRLLTKDLKLKDYLIPSSFGVIVLIYDLHRNPRVWPEPEKFDPDRFLPENSVNRHPFAYIPFSAGPRICIGFKFAMLEMKSFLAKVIREYILEPVDTPESVSFKMDIVLRPTKNVRVKFRKRNLPSSRLETKS